MKIPNMTILTLLGLALLGFATVGCNEGTTRNDVSDARQDLQDAKQNTAEAVREGQSDIANERTERQERTVAKPVTPDTDANDVADARHNANQNVADAKEVEREAAANLKTTEQQFQATQERDKFVKQAEQKLADYDKRIDELNQQASTAEGANKDAIHRQIDSVKSARDRAERALEELKDADIAAWKNHQDNVRLAFQALDTSAKNVK